MSWQSYVDDQLVATKTVTAAAIAGHDGNIWATSAGFPATAEEVRKVLASMGDTEALAMGGVTVGGVRYMYLSGDDKVLRARKKSSGVHVMKTVQAVILAVYEEPVVPEQCANTTEKLGEYLISVGY